MNRPASLAALLLVLAAACTGAPEMPPGAISSEAAQKLILERDDARDALAARERELAGEIERLNSENAELRSQLGIAAESAEDAAKRASDANAAAAQYQAGLGKAVEELNQVSQDAATAAKNRTYRAATPARAASGPRANISYFTTAHLSIVGDSIVASGRYYNDGDAEAIGVLYLDLIYNGQVVTTVEQQIRVNQKSWGSWQQEFHGGAGTSNVSVLPRFVED